MIVVPETVVPHGWNSKKKQQKNTFEDHIHVDMIFSVSWCRIRHADHDMVDKYMSIRLSGAALNWFESYLKDKGFVTTRLSGNPSPV